jgi:hypothetical protein
MIAASVLWAVAFFLGAPSAGAQSGCPGSDCETFCAGSGVPTDPDDPECAPNEPVYQVCGPQPTTCANGGLVVFGHGYVDPREDLSIPDYMIGGIPLRVLVNQQGFVWATSSLPKNGLAIQEGIEDLANLATLVRSQNPLLIGPALLVGASEGGAITALGVERHSHVFQGGLALCGPIGSFQKQINHFGDFRVVFDYFFPGVLPGTAINPDPPGLSGPLYPPVRDNWDTPGGYVDRIKLALLARPAATQQLLKVMRVRVDPTDPLNSVGEAVVGNLWYNVFGTYDAQATLGGQPFDNRWRFYTGSNNDFRLNRKVKRYRADYQARLEIGANYETSGRIDVPVVTSHTTWDPIVPYWHEWLYRAKTVGAGSWGMHVNWPVFKYGHCAFDETDAQTAFTILLYMVQAQGP